MILFLSVIVINLEFWIKFSFEVEVFLGFVIYILEFDNLNFKIELWSLNFGDVCESVKVWLNDELIGIVWLVFYKLNIGKLKSGKNILKI